MKTTLLQLGLVLVLLTVAAASASAQDYHLDDNETRAALSITADALLVRPVGAVMTAVGLAAFTASLPLTAINGSIDSTAEAWVRKPARNTFTRCLGCTRSK